VVRVPVDRRRDGCDPVVAAAGGGSDVWRWIQAEKRLARRAETVCGNPISGERLSRQRIEWNGPRTSRNAGAAEVAIPFRLRRHERGARDAAILEVPFHPTEEMDSVPEDRTAERAAEIVSLQFVLGLLGLLEEIVRRIERIVSAGVKRAATELVGPAAGDDVELRPPAPPNSGP
jgi:hypothetical protein